MAGPQIVLFSRPPPVTEKCWRCNDRPVPYSAGVGLCESCKHDLADPPKEAA